METSLVKFEDNGVALEARIECDGAWLTYAQAAKLFGVDESVIGKHVRSILEESELPPNCTARFAAQVAHGPSSRFVQIVHINQDMVFHIGYRVKSDRGFEFRQWATAVIKGEAAPRAIAKPPTLAELCLAQAQALVEQEHRLELTEKRVDAIEANFAERDAKASEIHELPPAVVPAPPKTYGQLTIEAVRAWGINNNSAFNDGFSKLYRDVEYRIGIDLKARKRNKPKLRMMDIIDSSGKSLEIYAIACEIFALGKAA